MAAMREIASGLQFPKAPIRWGDGPGTPVETHRGALPGPDPEGRGEAGGEAGDGRTGAAIGPDGAVYVCNNGGFEWHVVSGMTAPGHQPAGYIGGRIQRVTLDGKVTDLYTECGGHPLRGPNDIVFDAAGGFYFTDLGKTRERDCDLGGLYYAAPDGSRIEEVAYGLMQPNGVGLSPDGSRVYVAETTPG